MHQNNVSNTKINLSPTKEATGCKYKYNLKVINPDAKRDYKLQQIPSKEEFSSVTSLRDAIADVVPSGFTDIGYIEPGHGLKGRKFWITMDSDLIELYKQHNCKNCYSVLLWCHEGKKNRKRSFSETSEPVAKKPSNSCAQILSDVKEVADELRKKHGSSYSVEQLNCWAHMIHSEKHESTDTPPDLPYFKKPKHATTSNASDKRTSTASAPSVQNVWSHGILYCRRELLLRINNYDELQSSILNDIKEHCL